MSQEPKVRPLNQDTPPRPADIDRIPEPSHPTNTTKTINYIVAAALVTVALCLGVFLKWTIQDSQVLQVNNSPFPTRTIREHPTAGGVIILTADYCKIQDVPGKLRVSYVSSSREVFLPLADEKSPKGCRVTEFPVLIPRELQPDTYRIKFRVTYDVNPLKKGQVVEFESQPVVVDPSPPMVQ